MIKVAVSASEPGRTVASPEACSGGRVGAICPTSPQLCPGSLPQVSDETSNTSDGFDIPGLDDVEVGRGPGAEELTPEQETQLAEAQQAMEEARARLADVPAEVVVTNHVMGLYELAAIHLSSKSPDFDQAALAIDAVAFLVDGLGDRLGPEAPTMRDALNNIRLAFVQLKGPPGSSSS